MKSRCVAAGTESHSLRPPRGSKSAPGDSIRDLLIPYSWRSLNHLKGLGHYLPEKMSQRLAQYPFRFILWYVDICWNLHRLARFIWIPFNKKSPNSLHGNLCRFPTSLGITHFINIWYQEKWSSNARFLFRHCWVKMRKSEIQQSSGLHVRYGWVGIRPQHITW